MTLFQDAPPGLVEQTIGRSPGSWVVVVLHLPGFLQIQWYNGDYSSLTVAGTAPELWHAQASATHRIPFSFRKETDQRHFLHPKSNVNIWQEDFMGEHIFAMQQIREFAHCHIPPGGIKSHVMTEHHKHETHPDLVKRLKRAEGHLRHVIAMIEEDEPCTKIAIQLQAVEKAITNAKRTLIHDHIDHCLGNGQEEDLSEMKALAKLL